MDVVDAFRNSSILPVLDITDLVLHIGHHSHLTGIQRVQASIATSLLQAAVPTMFVSFDSTARRFVKLDAQVIARVLRELAMPDGERTFPLDRALARAGSLSGAEVVTRAAAEGRKCCILMLGTAWIVDDYFRSIGILKELLDANFACVVHDLIPIVLRDTCSDATVRAFRAFMAESRFLVDLYLCVSENTQKDLLAYFSDNEWPEPRVAVVRHGTDLPATGGFERPDWLEDSPAGHVLFVSTIEGRKNHRLLLKAWRRLHAVHGDALPRLLCVGRIGWRSEEFLIDYLSDAGAARIVELRTDVADRELAYLYETCRFTIYPSLYEGWGLPVSESLAHGRLCVCSRNSAMPEAGEDFALYIDPLDVQRIFATVDGLLSNKDLLAAAETKVRSSYKPRRWDEAAVDYIVQLERCAGFDRKPFSVSLPAHCVFRRSDMRVDGLIGRELIRRLHDHLRSELHPAPLRPTDFDDGRNARREGDWNVQEDWGCWIGLNGASLRFFAEESAEYEACFSYIVVEPFRGAALDIRANGISSRHRLSEAGGVAVLRFEFTSVAGDNSISFAGSPTPEQIASSFAIDRRGLMIGLREMRVHRKGQFVDLINANQWPQVDGSRSMRDDDGEIVRSAFAEGTMLRTDQGELPVEMLKPGDMLLLASGGQRPVRAVRRGSAAGGKGVLIPAHAVREGKPGRDVVVTADQYVCLKVVTECLVPVGLLTYKSTFLDIDVAERTFWHIELDDDDIVCAEGLEMPSGARLDAHLPERVEDLRLVEMIRAILKSRAAALGWSLNGAPPLDLHLLVDGKRLDPTSAGAVYRFVLPSTASDVWLVSECCVPKEVGVNADARLLGACVAELRIDDGLHVDRLVAIDDPRLKEGFHKAESECIWTDGCAQLNPTFWSDCQGIFFLTLRLALPALPRFCRPD